MVEVWIKKIREFEGLDKNADLVITADEAPNLFATLELDADKDGNITIKEWMSQKDNSSGMMWHEKISFQSIFNDDLISSGLARFREIGITNKYDVLIYLVKMYPVNETSMLDLIDLRTPVISTLIAMGFSQEEALRATEQIDKTGFSEKLGHFGEMLEKFGITTSAAKNAIISNLLEKRNYYILDDIDRLCKALEHLGCSENEMQEIFTYYYTQGLVWPGWINALSTDNSCNTIFSVISPNELKGLILDAARTDNSGILPSLIPEMATAIDALRSYGADEATIRRILIERMPEIRNGAGMIIQNIPDVLNAFSRLNIAKEKGPVHELLSWVNSIDPNGQAFWTFNSLPQEVDWLNSTFKDPAELNNIVAYAFLMPFSFISFHKIYDKLLNLGLNDFSGEDLCHLMGRAGITINHIPACNSLDAINTLEISEDKKKELMLLNMANSKILSQIDEIIEGLRKEKITDSDIFDILCSAVLSKCRAVTSVLLGACDVLKKIGIGAEDPHEMLPYLKRSLEHGEIGAILFDIKHTDNALKNMIFSKEDLVKIRENFPLGEMGPSEFWDFLIFVGNHKASLQETKDLDYYIDLCKRAKKTLGITRYGRYSPKILEAALSGERKEKHAFVPVARDDWNGSFYSIKYDLELLIDNGYSIDIVEASREEEIYRALEKYPPESIDLLFINGHGQPDRITLSVSTPDNEATVIDITDSEWKEHLLKMKSGGKVLFASCSTGNGPNSLVYKFEEWGGNERTLEFVAPPSPTGSSLIIRPDGTPDIEYNKDYKSLEPVRLLNQGKPN